MNRYFVTIIITLLALQSCAQIEKKQSNNNNNAEYRLFPTQNMWTLIKLNTRNGKLWQVQFDVSEDNRFVSTLSTTPLVSNDKEMNDRFTLYSTQNMYTFILLDQVDGKTWQVQWSTEAKNRFIIPIE
jgi:hypothetical protein